MRLPEYESVQQHEAPPLTLPEQRAIARNGWICETIALVILGAFCCAVAALNTGSLIILLVFFILGGLFFLYAFWDIYCLLTHREMQLYPNAPV
jgi:hypothetical protein